MSKPIIEVRNLSKRYRLGQIGAGSLRKDLEGLFLRTGKRQTEMGKAGDLWALKEVSFDVQPGEVLGIIGRNGAGKSTLLKILSRITEPTTGQAVLRGRVASLLEVGTGFHPELTGRENVYLNGAILGMKRREIEARFDEIVAFADMGPFIDTPVKRYSSGMYVRLAFAVAAHLDADILVVDEVLAVGDAVFQKRCLQKVGSLTAGEGRTVLIVSHQMDVVRRLCDRVVLIGDGRLLRDGNPPEVVQEYLGQGDAPLATRLAQRPGVSGRARLVDAWLECQGQRATRVVSGEDTARLVLVFETDGTGPVATEVVLCDQNGQPVAFAPSGILDESDAWLEQGRYLVACRLPPLHLAQGVYSLDLILAVSGQELLDHAAAAVSFTVEAARVGPKNWTFSQAVGRGCMLWGATFDPPRLISHG